MKPRITHSWDLMVDEAIALQKQLATHVIREDAFEQVNYVAGVDVAYEEEQNRLIAAIVILEAGSLKVMEQRIAEDIVRFPYVPGLFSFRELPAIIKALEQVETPPDLIVCDGQGFAHPRRFGLACHLGVLFDLPAIGCGKTRLLGESAEPGPKRGDFSLLIDQDEPIGCVLRTQDQVKPIYVSIGHRISLETACQWILRLTPRYRLPEVIRQADQLVRKVLKEKKAV